MTTVELLAYCKGHTKPPCAPDLIWQRLVHYGGILHGLRNGDNSTRHNGFHDTHRLILEHCSWLVARERTYTTILFTESAACSKPQK